METELTSGGLTLRGHLALPPPSAGGPGIIRHGLVLCHGFPPGPRGAATAGQTYPQAPQLAGSEFTFVHVPLQQTVPAAQQT